MNNVSKIPTLVHLSYFDSVQVTSGETIRGDAMMP